MNELDQNPDMIVLQRSLAGALVHHLQLPVNVFGPAFVKIPEDKSYQASVDQWWNTLNPAARWSHTLLSTLAAPALVVDLQVMLGKNSLIRSWALAGGKEPDAPWLLAGYDGKKDEFQIRQLDSREELLNTLLAWIEANAGFFVPKMKFEVSAPEFAVLLAIVDLYSRAYYSAYLTHNAVTGKFTVDHIIQAYQEAMNIPDPRWLLSFCAQLLPDDACALQSGKILQCLAGLTDKGLLQQDSASGEVSFTAPGLFLAESFHRRICLVGLDIAGAGETGVMGSHSGLFVRSDEPLWYCDIGSDNKVTVLGADMDMVRQILESLLTPLAVPPLESDIKTPQPVPLQPNPAMPPMPSPDITAAIPCAKCGFILGKDAVFCSKCGAPVEKAATPPPPSLPPQSKVCLNCNRTLGPNAKFCAGCGKPV